MFSLLRKELISFFGNLLGYITIIVFVTLISLFMWVFPGDFNILDAGYANIDTLFMIAPWIFMFLIPAITMRFFSEELKIGTIELLFTKPLTDLQIVMAKYFAGFILVIFALLPTFTYLISVYFLGNPIGNIDFGATWGSYLGLLFLAAGFLAIGIFSSSLTDNAIVAFIIGVFICFFFYVGFESISSFDLFGKFDIIILNLGINEHYVSMSRGVIDTRDVVYFLSLTTFFIVLTLTKLESRKW
jgi:ABC-2 type transport system permease protein